MLLITSGASLLWNMLAGKGVTRAELSYPVTNFRIQRYYLCMRCI